MPKKKDMGANIKRSRAGEPMASFGKAKLSGSRGGSNKRRSRSDATTSMPGKVKMSNMEVSVGGLTTQKVTKRGANIVSAINNKNTPAGNG